MPAWSPSGTSLAFVSRGPTRVPDSTGWSCPAKEHRPWRSPSSTARSRLLRGAPTGSRVALRLLETGTTSADAMGLAPIASRLLLVPADGGDPSILETPDDVFPFRANGSATTSSSIRRPGLSGVTRSRRTSSPSGSRSRRRCPSTGRPTTGASSRSVKRRMHLSEGSFVPSWRRMAPAWRSRR